MKGTRKCESVICEQGSRSFFLFFVFVLSRSLEQAKVKESFQYSFGIVSNVVSTYDCYDIKQLLRGIELRELELPFGKF